MAGTRQARVPRVKLRKRRQKKEMRSRAMMALKMSLRDRFKWGKTCKPNRPITGPLSAQNVDRLSPLPPLLLDITFTNTAST
eukprot:9468659-Pyramimonas_sp.AAC.1